MKNKPLQQGVIFGIGITVFNIGYQYFINNGSGWELIVSSVIGGLVGGVVYGLLMSRKYKKMNQK